MKNPIIAHCWRDAGALISATSDGHVTLIDLATQKEQQIGQHQSGLQCVKYISEMQCVASAGWDGQLHFWDMRQARPACSVQHKAPIFSMDALHPLLVTSDANNLISVINLSAPQTIFQEKKSPLSHQTRKIACMPDRAGYIMCMAEGRCACQWIDPAKQRNYFSFRCHREGQVTYAVNDIAVHPFGSFATCGSDGVVNYWDYKSKSRLKPFKKIQSPLTAIAFNTEGSMCAYAAGYDWHKGQESAASNTRVAVFIHKVDQKEVTPRGKKF